MRFNSACRSRIWSACMVPIVVSQWTATWLPFFAASGSMVLTTSSISGARAKVSRLSSIRPASIFDRSRMSLIKASRWRPAPSTRSSGSMSCFQTVRDQLAKKSSCRPGTAHTFGKDNLSLPGRAPGPGPCVSRVAVVGSGVGASVPYAATPAFVVPRRNNPVRVAGSVLAC
jgi:hypothetical protein